MCAILEEERFLCTGSLVGPGIVIASAQCIHQYVSSRIYKVSHRNNKNTFLCRSNPLTVRCGEWDRQTLFEPLAHQDRLVDKRVVHPQYNKKKATFDIALLFLQDDFDLSEHIDVTCLPEIGRKFTEEDCHVVGWRYGENAYVSIL